MAEYQLSDGAAPVTTETDAERIGGFLRSVYAWMGVGLALTAIVAMFVAASPDLVLAIASNRLLFWALIIAQFGIVILVSSRVQSLSPTAAGALFVAYSALTGVTMSFVLLAYTEESVAGTFMVSASMFGAMAAYGTLTRRSLAGWTQFLFMGLIGVVVASVVGVFWQNDGFQFVTAFIGVIVFTGLAAWDAQNLKRMAVAAPHGHIGSYAIVGALSLYLDFINLFLMLLRLAGRRR